MRIVLVCLLFLGSYLGMAQEVLNNYKYIIVPKKFDGFRKQNQYQTSTMVKFRFVQKGFTAVYDDAMPEELMLNRCLGLMVHLENESNMFTTKGRLVLKDCTSKKIFETELGISRIKEFIPAYREVINNMFKSFTGVYKYKTQKETPITISFKDDVKVIESEKPIIEQKATLEEQSFKSMEPQPSTIKQNTVSISSKKEKVLYAQEINNGFQLVDSTPKIQLKIYKSSIADFYLASTTNKNGVVYARNDKWYFEYYEGENLVVEELNIKF